jgi:hypothetical protein
MSIQEVTGIGCNPGSSLGRSFYPQQRGRSAYNSDRHSSSAHDCYHPGVLCLLPMAILTGGVPRLPEFRPESGEIAQLASSPRVGGSRRKEERPTQPKKASVREEQRP